MDYTSMKYPEIKSLCNDRGLSSKGKKVDLIARLVQHDEEKRIDAARFKVSVKTLMGSWYTIYPERDDTILALKQKIEEKTGCPPEKQRLTLLNTYTHLEDDKTLSDYGIRNDDFLGLSYRL
jgi:hypothetical protein